MLLVFFKALFASIISLDPHNSPVKPFTLKIRTWKQGTFKTLQKKKCSKITKKFPQHPYHGSNLNCIYWKLYWLERWQRVNSFSAPDCIQTEVVRNTKELWARGGGIWSPSAIKEKAAVWMRRQPGTGSVLHGKRCPACRHRGMD